MNKKKEQNTQDLQSNHQKHVYIWTIGKTTEKTDLKKKIMYLE